MTAGAPGSRGRTAAMEALYPFLYATRSDRAAVMAEVRQSTLAKISEIAELRRLVCARDSDRLLACAADMASRFTSGGRLLAFGNGGSCHRCPGDSHAVPPPRSGQPGAARVRTGQ